MKYAAHIHHIIVIFPKIRGKSQHFIPCIQKDFQNHIQATCCPNGHNQIAFVIICTKTAVQTFRNGFSCRRDAAAVCVTMYLQGIHILQNFNGSCIDGCRCFYIGIANAKVVYIFRPINGCQPFAFCKHGAHGRTLFYHLFHFLRNHNISPFWKFPMLPHLSFVICYRYF